MPKFSFRKLKKRLTGKYKDIDPEDIFMDSTNLPGFDEAHMEGRIERPMSSGTFIALKVCIALMLVALVFKLGTLEIKKGSVYAQISENNRLEHTIIFANRGVIVDRKGEILASNATRTEENSFAARVYSELDGLSSVVGYLKYPSRDANGYYYDVNYRGRDGVERAYDAELSGKNGIKLRETDALGNITSESVIEKPEDGALLTLSLDAKLTDELYKDIKALAEKSGYTGGAGVIMDIETGELLALTSYPEYDQGVMTEGSDKSAVNAFLNSSSKPFLNRAISGLYSPGSILKPIVALGALEEGIISPEKKILSTGSISVPNPYDPDKPSIFKDWKAHGWTDMREAIAVSSDVYFYTIGGGFGGQKGLGINNLDKYFSLFGINEITGINLAGESQGVIPSPEWKAKNFNGDAWRLGDTYHTAIGQYGTQVTPIGAARFISALVNGGKLLTPSVLLNGEPNPVARTVEIPADAQKVVLEGMRAAVLYGTSVGLNVPYVKVAGKTGTAEIGSNKKYINSWSTGYFPYENPKYAFAIIMEKGPTSNSTGATSVTRQLFDWMSIYTPEYFH